MERKNGRIKGEKVKTATKQQGQKPTARNLFKLQQKFWGVPQTEAL